MPRHHEIEIKLPIRDLKVLKGRLVELGFRVIRRRRFESNTVYDFPDRRLWKARCLLRLRLTGRTWLLTFKGPPVQSRPYKVRGELETRIEDGKQLSEILQGLGLRLAFRYEKYRTVYMRSAPSGKRDRAQLVCDETPIGDYLELEGPRAWIDAVARRLGYRKEDYITASYGRLYRHKCMELGEKVGDMVFPPRKSRLGLRP